MHAYQLIQLQQAPEVRDLAEPEPGPGQVVVRIGGAGVCHSDLHLIHDFPPGALPIDLPFTLGHENAGWVHALGAGVTGLEVGEPVAVYGPWGCGRCTRCRLGMENYCERQAEIRGFGGGLGFDGGMAPYMLVPDARLLVPIGDLDPVDAAPLTDAGLTPYHAVRRSLPKLVAGSRAVVIGVGGLGHMGVQILAATTPAEIIAVDRDPDALALATAGGAHHVVQAGPDAADAVRDATKGKGADVVLDFVGSDDSLTLAVAASRSLGDVTLVGIAGGSIPFSFFSGPYEVSFATTYWGSVTELMEVIALAQQGRISATVQRFGLDNVADAYAALHAGAVRGRAVVVPGTA
jgi:propanol-preferring alcohol dehydrogenase